jgi:hypothetical protein
MALATWSIGAQSFIRLDGELAPKSQKLANRTRPGVNGVAFLDLGIQGDESELVGIVDISGASSANGLRASYASLVGTIVTIVLESQSYANYLILDARVTKVQAVLTPRGGLVGGDHLVESRWRVIYAGT